MADSHIARVQIIWIFKYAVTHGAYNAANLDGGGSSALDYQGKTINRPSDITGERAVPTAFFLIMP